MLQNRRGSIAIDASWVLMGPIMPQLGCLVLGAWAGRQSGRELRRSVHRPALSADRRALARRQRSLSQPGAGARAGARGHRSLVPLRLALREGAARGPRTRDQHGRRGHAARPRRMARRASPLQARVHDADRLVQGPRHDGDDQLSQEPRYRSGAGRLVRQRRRVARRLCRRGGHAVPHPRSGDRVVSEDRPDRRDAVPTW